MDGKDDAISPTLMCRMLYPFWMLRSAIVIRFIKKEIWVNLGYKASSETGFNVYKAIAMSGWQNYNDVSW